MKKLLIDQEGKVYEFDGQTTSLLSKPQQMISFGENIVIIGDAVFHKKGDRLSLICRSGECFRVSEKEAGHISRAPYFLGLVGALKPDAGMLAKGFELLKHVPENDLKPGTVILHDFSGDEYSIVHQDGTLEAVQRISASGALIDAFIYNGRAYIKMDNIFFHLSSISLGFVAQDYLIWNAANLLFKTDRLGEVSMVGQYEMHRLLGNHYLIGVRLSGSATALVHLEPSKTNLLCFVDKKDALNVSEDGTIVHRYTRTIMSYEPDVTREDVYKLCDGSYKKVSSQEV